MKRIFQFIKNPFHKRDAALSQFHENPLYKHDIRKHFSKNRPGLYSFYFLCFLVFIALCADFLANKKPLIAKYKGTVYFPVIRGYAVDLGIAKWPSAFGSQIIDWQNLKYDAVLLPPVPYLPEDMDGDNARSVSPFGKQNISSLRWRHWLGTDENGRDVLAGMIHGTRIALTVGLISMGIASVLGIMLGAMAGYFGDTSLKISRASMLMNSLFFVLAFFEGFIARSYEIADALAASFLEFHLQILFSLFIMAVILIVGNILAIPFKAIPFLRKKILVPVDIIISRLIEIVDSIPILILIICISAIVAHPSIYIVMAIIGLTSWPHIARFMRAEVLRIRSLGYIEAARALGYSRRRIIFRHVIPNALSPVLITIAFGIAAAILIESTLSFLGVGVAPETVTWGSLLATARKFSSSWWLAVIPGSAIFITVTIFNLLGETLTDALDPKQKK